MQHTFEKYGKYAEITGFRGVSFTVAEQFLKENRKQNGQTVIQFFNADLIATNQHLKFAVINAVEAFKGKTNISKNLAVEIMLYASMQRQIQRAIEKIGASEDSKNVAVVVLGESQEKTALALKEIVEYFGVQPDESVLELTSKKEAHILQAFRITDKEIQATSQNDSAEAVVNLIIEREALLATQF
ncbi:MAG: KEOPS complex subunit Cgi121 [Candidatus Bathyarchaeota archaeon]|nr:KEOPS complex subunit Cgi121 [Candidatus Bathyarchaeota archaeon]